MKKIVPMLALLLCAFWPTTGRAEFSIGLGYALGVSPYRDYDTRQSLWPLIAYEGERVYIRDLSLGLKLYEPGPLELSVFLAYDPQNFDPGDSGDFRLRRLDHRRESLLAGGRARWESPVGDFDLSLAGDVSGHSQGLLGRLAYQRSFDFDRLRLTPRAGLYWASEKYNDYYFGVSRREADKSGLKQYQAGAGVSPFLGLGLSLGLDEAEHWRLFGYGEVAALPRAVKDSPMVDRSTTYGLATGVMYTFR